MSSMVTFPIIETTRLFLNEIKHTDVPIIVNYASNKKVSDFTQNIPYPYAEEDAKIWIIAAQEGFEKGTQFTFAIRLKPGNQFIGGIGLKKDRKHHRAELGYWIAEKFWNHGYATEAARALVKYGFQNINLNKITASHFAENFASGKVLTHCKMIREGVLKEQIFKNEIYNDLIIYGLTKEDYYFS